MKYEYTARFLPSGVEDPDSASDIKEVNFISDNKNPKPEDRKKAEVQLQKKLGDSYVARNYWCLSDYLITYHNPPWNAKIEIRRAMDKISRPGVRTRTSKKREEFVSMDYDDSVDPDNVINRLESKFDIQIDKDTQVEKLRSSAIKFYTHWSVEA